jgi:hypothetical protein
MPVEPQGRRAGDEQVAGHDESAVEDDVLAQQLLQRTLDAAAAVEIRRVANDDRRIGLRRLSRDRRNGDRDG